MKIDDDLLKSNPELLERVLNAAVDACWACIESGSLRVLAGDAEWMDLTEDFSDLLFDIGILKDLGLLEVHPQHPTWVREIAE